MIQDICHFLNLSVTNVDRHLTYSNDEENLHKVKIPKEIFQSRNITDSAHNVCLTKLSTIPLIKDIWTSSVKNPSSKNFPSPDKNWQCTQCGVHHACEKSISNPIDQQYSHQLIIPTASSKNFTSRIWNIKPPIDGQNCHHSTKHCQKTMKTLRAGNRTVLNQQCEEGNTTIEEKLQGINPQQVQCDSCRIILFCKVCLELKDFLCKEIERGHKIFSLDRWLYKLSTAKIHFWVG